MSLSAYLWGIRLFILLSLSVWLSIVFAVDPEQAGTIGVSLFFISLFAMVLGFLMLFIAWVYRQGLGEAGAAHHLGGAFRQAFLLAMYAVAVIFFQYARILTWWDGLLLLAAVLLLEFSFRRIFQKHET